MLIKHTKIEEKTVAASAFHDGMNKVVLGIQSEELDHHWDFVARNSKDRKWYYGDAVSFQKMRCSKSFQRIGSQYSTRSLFDDELIYNLIDKNIKPLTTGCGQNLPEWFLVRMFSITSLAANQIVRTSTGDEEGFDTDAWTVVQEYQN